MVVLVEAWAPLARSHCQHPMKDPVWESSSSVAGQCFLLSSRTPHLLQLMEMV